MSDMGCPYIAGPACCDCDGSCWHPTPPQQPRPEPCETCSRIDGGMTYCLDLCTDVHSEADLERAIANRHGGGQ